MGRRKHQIKCSMWPNIRTEKFSNLAQSPDWKSHETRTFKTFGGFRPKFGVPVPVQKQAVGGLKFWMAQKKSKSDGWGKCLFGEVPVGRSPSWGTGSKNLTLGRTIFFNLVVSCGIRQKWIRIKIFLRKSDRLTSPNWLVPQLAFPQLALPQTGTFSTWHLPKLHTASG